MEKYYMLTSEPFVTGKGTTILNYILEKYPNATYIEISAEEYKQIEKLNNELFLSEIDFRNMPIAKQIIMVYKHTKKQHELALKIKEEAQKILNSRKGA